MYITNEKYDTKAKSYHISNERDGLLKDSNNNRSRTMLEKHTQIEPVITNCKFSNNKENINKDGVCPIYENIPPIFSRSNSGSSGASMSSGHGPAKPLVGILKVPGRRKQYFTKHVEFLEDQELSVRQF